MMMGVMIAIGPLAIDMYLPALPTMADDFGVSVSEVSKSVPFYFYWFGVWTAVLWTVF